MAQAKSHHLHALSPDEKRSEGRTSTVFRPVLIEADGFACFCLVRNISSSGLMGEVYTSFAPETPTTLHFEPITAINGKVKWCKEGRIGIEFDETIDVAEVLSAVATKTFDGKVNRAPRLHIQASGEVIFERRPIPIEVQNISQKGIRVGATFLEPGEEVEVRLSGMPSRKAVVRWTQHGTAGLNFISPIPFAELAEWVIATNLSPNVRPGVRLAIPSGSAQSPSGN